MTAGHRRSVRVLLKSPQNRILLFLSHFEPGSGLEPAWVFPGGGIEPGETEIEAVIRELREETGQIFGPEDLQEPFLVLGHKMPDQRIYTSGEAHFFELVIQSEFEPNSAGWTLEEHRDTVAHRCWSLEEILSEEPWVEPSGSIEVISSRLA